VHGVVWYVELEDGGETWMSGKELFMKVAGLIAKSLAM